MSDVFLLSESQMKRIEPFFPLAHGMPRVDDRRVLSGIVGLQWKDAPKAYGPHKTLYNRFIRWSRLGVFDRIFKTLAEQAGRSKRLMISMRRTLKRTERQPLCLKKDFSPPYRTHKRRSELKTSCPLPMIRGDQSDFI